MRAIDAAVEVHADEDLRVMLVAEALQQENEWRHRVPDYLSSTRAFSVLLG